MAVELDVGALQEVQACLVETALCSCSSGVSSVFLGRVDWTEWVLRCGGTRTLGHGEEQAVIEAAGNVSRQREVAWHAPVERARIMGQRTD